MKKIGLLLILILGLSACETETLVEYINPINATFTFSHNELERSYDLYIPENTPKGAPLMLMLHGFTSDKETIRLISKMDDYANKYKFAVVYPQGAKSSLSFLGQTIEENHWNAGLSLSEIDDTSFLVELTQFIQDTYALSQENTFVSGFSNGGFMAYTLACEASETFKGIGVVSGLMSGETYKNCDPLEPVDIIHIHGTSDLVVPADGTMFAPGGWGGAPEVPVMLEKWMMFNDVSVTETNRLFDRIKEVKANHPSHERKVHYYLIDGYPHDWPVSPNPNELGIDPFMSASEYIVAFLILPNN
jgi:polyhydroxybutyrate depolymerase